MPRDVHHTGCDWNNQEYDIETSVCTPAVHREGSVCTPAVHREGEGTGNHDKRTPHDVCAVELTRYNHGSYKRLQV